MFCDPIIGNFKAKFIHAQRVIYRRAVQARVASRSAVRFGKSGLDAAEDNLRKPVNDPATGLFLSIIFAFVLGAIASVINMSSALIMLGVAFALTVFGQRFMPFSDSARKMFVRTMLPLILFLGVWIYLKYEKPASKSDTDSIKSDTQAIRDVLKRQTEKVAGPALTEIPTAKLEPPMLFAEFLDGVTDEAGSTSLSAYKWSHSGDTGFIQQNVRFRNHGGTPAVISSLKCGAIVSAVAPNQTVIDGADEVPIKTEIVIPQNERSVPFTCGPWVRWFPAPNPVQLRQDASHKLERMANGEVWFVGRVDYTDVNGTSSTTTLCARYRISGALELAGGDGCNQHTRSQR